MSCDRCADPHYFQLTRVSDDVARHAVLCRCPACGDLFEVLPEVKRPPRPVTRDEAQRLFTGPWGPSPAG